MLGVWPSGDDINAIFEFGGAYQCWKSVARLYRDKRVAGINVGQAVFFTTWGVWNLFYYPSLHQWQSTIAAAALLSANGTWSAMAFYYGGGFCTLTTTLQNWSRRVKRCLNWCAS